MALLRSFTSPTARSEVRGCLGTVAPQKSHPHPGSGGRLAEAALGHQQRLGQRRYAPRPARPLASAASSEYRHRARRGAGDSGEAVEGAEQGRPAGVEPQIVCVDSASAEGGVAAAAAPAQADHRCHAVVYQELGEEGC